MSFLPLWHVYPGEPHWRFDCPHSEITVEEHRVWLLPTTHVGIVEQRHLPVVLDVVRTADIA